MSEKKPKFRSRKLDNAKPLVMYRYDEIDDLDEYGSPLRTVTHIATGVDKEEEEVDDLYTCPRFCGYRSTIYKQHCARLQPRASRTTSQHQRLPRPWSTT